MLEIRDRLAAVCPRIAARVTDLEVATPLTIRDQVHTPVGSLYGIKRRPGDHVLGSRTRAEGLYLAGQSVMAPGIVGAMVSSFVACGTILGHQRIREGLEACR